MIKRTLFFGNPAYLSTRNEQLVVNFPKEEREEKRRGRNREGEREREKAHVVTYILYSSGGREGPRGRRPSPHNVMMVHESTSH